MYSSSFSSTKKQNFRYVPIILILLFTYNIILPLNVELTRYLFFKPLFYKIYLYKGTVLIKWNKYYFIASRNKFFWSYKITQKTANNLWIYYTRYLPYDALNHCVVSCRVTNVCAWSKLIIWINVCGISCMFLILFWCWPG